MYEVIVYDENEGLDELTDVTTMQEALRYIRKCQAYAKENGFRQAIGYGVWNYSSSRITRTVGYFPFQANENGVLSRC